MYHLLIIALMMLKLDGKMAYMVLFFQDNLNLVINTVSIGNLQVIRQINMTFKMNGMIIHVPDMHVMDILNFSNLFHIQSDFVYINSRRRSLHEYVYCLFQNFPSFFDDVQTDKNGNNRVYPV